MDDRIPVKRISENFNRGQYEMSSNTHTTIDLTNY